MQYLTMHSNFEAQKNREALLYTLVVCGGLLLLFLFKWQLPQISQPLTQETLEINLGNDMEGFGEEQPLIKGEMSPEVAEPATVPQQQNSAIPEPEQESNPAKEEENDEEAAPVNKPVQPVTKPVPPTNKSNAPVVRNPQPNPTPTPPNPAPPKPRAPLYKGPGNGNGNGATEDNGYRYQGNKPGGTGDAGSPNGNPDSYGTRPGGRTGGNGPKVFGNRQIVRYYSFTGDLDKATIYAIVQVSPSGVGTFRGFGKNSTARSQAYANEIIRYLGNIKFNAAAEESTVTVQFNFNVN